MNRIERLESALAGRQPDRVPVSAWGHFYDRETSAEGLASAMIEFSDKYDWDFVKVHARASYHVEGWGFTYEPSRDPASLHVCTSHPIRSVADWRQLKPLPLSTPALAEQFKALELIRAGIPSDMPLIMTVFSPLDIAEKLVDRNAALLKQHIEEDPDAVATALASFAETFAAFVRKLDELGIDGIYFSTKWANDQKLTARQYDSLVRPYDRIVLDEAKGFWCNMLHLCEDHVQLSAMGDYPVHVLHWDAYTGHNPSYGEGRIRSGKVVSGGVDAATLASSSPEAVTQRARASIRETGGAGFILSPGCSVQIAQTSHDNLLALRAAAEIV